MSKIHHIKTVTEAHQASGMAPPRHPLISLTFHRDIPATSGNAGVKFSSDLYLIGMKDGVSGSFGYGRSDYDFQEGTLIFIQPQQVVVSGDVDISEGSNGWTLLFHPDLFRHYPLADQISKFSFFSYETNEALHLSDQEKESLTEIALKIEKECQQNIDRHTEELIVSNLDTLLKYCKRYYDRQFFTRSNLNKDLISKFETYVQAYFASEELQEKGLPTLEDCGKAMHLSGNYLSDMLRLETGKSAMEHIRTYAVEQAKNTLLNSQKSISEIAYEMGFSYSQNFSRLFKSQTGMSPGEYRKSH